MRRWIYGALLLSALVLAFTLLACGGQATPPEPSPTAQEPASPVSPLTTPRLVSPVSTPPQTGAATASAPQIVVFSTEDRVRLSGTLYGAGRPVAVVASHMFPTDQTSWTPLAAPLTDKGYAMLAYDFRGYGFSGGDRNVADIDKDLLAAVAFVRSQGAKKVVLVGASMGGTATLKVAAKEQPAAVLILSAPDSFQGLSVTPEEIKAISAPKLFIGSEGDGATKTTLAMFEQASQPKEKHVYPGNAHGTFIFSTDQGPDLIGRIVDFIAANVPPD